MSKKPVVAKNVLPGFVLPPLSQENYQVYVRNSEIHMERLEREKALFMKEVDRLEKLISYEKQKIESYMKKIT